MSYVVGRILGKALFGMERLVLQELEILRLNRLESEKWKFKRVSFTAQGTAARMRISSHPTRIG